jgi:hypothetical protein
LLARIFAYLCTARSRPTFAADPRALINTGELLAGVVPFLNPSGKRFVVPTFRKEREKPALSGAEGTGTLIYTAPRKGEPPAKLGIFFEISVLDT